MKKFNQLIQNVVKQNLISQSIIQIDSPQKQVIDIKTFPTWEKLQNQIGGKNENCLTYETSFDDRYLLEASLYIGKLINNSMKIQLKCFDNQAYFKDCPIKHLSTRIRLENVNNDEDLQKAFSEFEKIKNKYFEDVVKFIHNEMSDSQRIEFGKFIENKQD